MELRNKVNGGTVRVSEEYAARLVATGDYEEIKKAPAPRRRSSKRSKEG